MKTATKKLRSPLKWHGGKSYLARRIITGFPEHSTYIEPFAGGLSVLLNKLPAVTEVVGDVDAKLMLFWGVLADRARFWQFLEHVDGTSYEREVFEKARVAVDHAPPNPWEFEAINWERFAAYYLIRNRFSRGGIGESFAWSDRLRGGQPGDVNAWETIKAELRATHDRLEHVKFVPGDAVDLIEHFDAPGALIYCDPPYLAATRTARKVYAHEMDDVAHCRLLETLLGCQGRVILSGYAHPVYDRALEGWKRTEISMPNHSGQGKTKQRRVEVLWESLPLAAMSPPPRTPRGARGEGVRGPATEQTVQRELELDLDFLDAMETAR